MDAEVTAGDGLRWADQSDELGCFDLRDSRGRLCGWVIEDRPEWVGHLASGIASKLGQKRAWRFFPTESDARAWVMEQAKAMGAGRG